MGTASQSAFPDGSQIEVKLCGIDAPEMKQDKAPDQPLANEVKQKLLNLVAAADNQLIIIPLQRDNHHRSFKHFYLEHVQKQWRCAFPELPNYQQFVESMPSVLIPLCAYLKYCFGKCTNDKIKIAILAAKQLVGHRFEFGRDYKVSGAGLFLGDIWLDDAAD